MSPSFSHLGLILFTCGRHLYLERSLAYLKQIGVEQRTVVVDGSITPWTSAQTTSANYHHLPGMPIVARIRHALEVCDAPYIHLVADDDFLLPHYLLHGIDWLEHHESYCAVHGFLGRVSLGEHIIFACQNRLDVYRDQAASNVQERLWNCYNPFLQQVYALLRRNVLENFCGFAEMLDQGAHMNPVFERIFTLVVAMTGKNKYLDTLSVVREGDNPKTARFVSPIKMAEAWVEFSQTMNAYLERKGLLTEALRGMIDGYAEQRMGDEFMRLRGVEPHQEKECCTIEERLRKAREAETHAHLYRHAEASMALDASDRISMIRAYAKRGSGETVVHIPHIFAHAHEASVEMTDLNTFLHQWIAELAAEVDRLNAQQNSLHQGCS